MSGRPRPAGCRLPLSEMFQDGPDLGDLLFVSPIDPANQRLTDQRCRKLRP